MRRFWKQATAAPGGGVVLDGRPLRTPARAELIAPTLALAEAIAAEWNAAGDTVDPRAMPLTGLANAAIDRIAPDLRAFAAPLAAYAEADVIAYRADHPPALVAAEAAAWDPWVEWARRRLDIGLVVTAGVVHAPQPPGTAARVAATLETLGPFRLAAADPLVRISGSAVLALAVLLGELDADGAFDAGHADELWQITQWGEDDEAARARESRRAALRDAARFLSLL